MDRPWKDAIWGQHGAAQLNLLLRQNLDDAPRWVGKAPDVDDA